MSLPKRRVGTHGLQPDTRATCRPGILTGRGRIPIPPRTPHPFSTRPKPITFLNRRVGTHGLQTDLQTLLRVDGLLDLLDVAGDVGLGGEALCLVKRHNRLTILPLRDQQAPLVDQRLDLILGNGSGAFEL